MPHLMDPLIRSSTTTPSFKIPDDDEWCHNSYVQVWHQRKRKEECCTWIFTTRLLPHSTRACCPAVGSNWEVLSSRAPHAMLACEAQRCNFPAVRGLATIRLQGWLNSWRNPHKLQRQASTPLLCETTDGSNHLGAAEELLMVTGTLLGRQVEKGKRLFISE